MYDICALGDALIDFLPADNYTNKLPVFQCQAGGTSCNLSVAASHLGASVLFVGKVGADCMGDLVLNTMRSFGVHVDGCPRDAERFTTLSFISLNDNGERSFNFCRSFSAETNLTIDELDTDRMMNTKMLEYSAGMVLTDEPLRSTCMEVLKEARKRGVMVAVDINYRENLWDSIDEMIRVKSEALRYTDLYKSSRDEAFLLTGKETLEEAAKEIIKFGCKLVVITCGRDGSYFYMPSGESGMAEPYEVTVVDTTGAGDCFYGAFLSRVAQRGGIEGITGNEVLEMCRFGNAAGALNITKKGAVLGVPSETQILNLIALSKRSKAKSMQEV